MERVDSAHSYVEDLGKNSKPIFMSTNTRKSISGVDILNGLKNIATNNDSSISLAPSQFSEYQVSHIDDFDLKEAIGYYTTSQRETKKMNSFFFYDRLRLLSYCL